MNDCQQISDNRSVEVNLKGIPAMMQDTELNEFCSLFGTVKSITRSNKTQATIQYNEQSFHDHIATDEVSDARTDSVDVFTPFGTEDLWRNEKFLSDLLNILVNETRDQEQRDVKPKDEELRVKEPRDENQNVVDSLESKSRYLECTYCFSVADYLCERCRSPYCSTKCQHIDWLQHKKSCAKVRNYS